MCADQTSKQRHGRTARSYGEHRRTRGVTIYPTLTKRVWRWLVMLALVAVSAACSVGAAPPIPTAIGAATATTELTATTEPTATTVATTVPTSTATPEPTVTAEPTATVEPTPTVIDTATLEPTPTIIDTATPETVQTDTGATTVPTVAPTEVARVPFDAALGAELQRILDATVADRSIPGVSLAVYVDGREPWIGTSGTLDREGTTPLLPDARMRIASISKVFTGVVIMQLVEEGKLDLDAPISTWFPGLLPSGDRTTVRQLLNHTTGLYDYLEDRNYRNVAYGNGGRVWAARELVAHAAQFPLLFEPGTPGAFDYSSTNYVILGMIAEQVTGRPFAQEMRARIFEPLNLESTYFAPDDAVLGTAARGYGGEFDQTDISLSFAFATANIVSTPENVMRFGQALQRGELLDHATMAQMFTFVNGLGQYNMPALEYGLGIMRNQLAVGPNASGAPRDTATRTVMGHIGGFGGFRSAMWTTPDGEITIALGMNQGAADPNILATGVFDAVLRSLGR